MSEVDMKRFAELAQDFYAEKQAESGHERPIRKAWASNEKGGLLIIVSCDAAHSRALAEQTGIPWSSVTGFEKAPAGGVVSSPEVLRAVAHKLLRRFKGVYDTGDLDEVIAMLAPVPPTTEQLSAAANEIAHRYFGDYPDKAYPRLLKILTKNLQGSSV